MSVPTSLRLDEEIDARLQRLAQRTGRTKTYYINQAILLQLENIEDMELAAERYREHLASGEPAIPLDEVFDDR
ncbi:MAG: ribbon-helix-helix protein, CopG family [Pseudonocardiales bacterium]|nr:ribbon-helix-helix protein, CopG family [Pseudonocardiales bacterium]